MYAHRDDVWKKPVLRHSSSNWHISNSETQQYNGVYFMVNTIAFLILFVNNTYTAEIIAQVVQPTQILYT